MSVHDLVVLFASFIVVVGWYVTGHINREKDIVQKRLEFRLKALEAILPVLSAFHIAISHQQDPFSSPDLVSQLNDAQVKMEIYGLPDEQEMMRTFMGELMDKSTYFSKTYRDFAILVRNRIRNELNIVE